MLLPPKPQLQPGVLEITAIDVGQGDSLLIVTPEGKTLLLDSGGLGATSRSDFDVGEEVVSPYLWSRGIRRLDAVAISHPHSDHIGGMRSIIANFRPRELWYGLESPTRDFAEVEKTAKDFGVALDRHHAGERVQLRRDNDSRTESAARTGSLATRRKTTSHWCCICNTAKHPLCWSATRTDRIEKLLIDGEPAG